jgi:mannose/fructose/N-acetylgalactosamine-specific phosphotransferase system component IID
LIQALIVATGSLFGAFFFFLFFATHILLRAYSLADAAWDCGIAAIGALVGGLFFSWASKR